jgi:hypothetical protein
MFDGTFMPYFELKLLELAGTLGTVARTEVEHLTFIRGEVLRQIDQRREPLIIGRDLARDMSEILEDAYDREQHTSKREGKE